MTRRAINCSRRGHDRLGLDKAAGRATYIAGFHAAQGFRFETTGKVFKTHWGVQSEFGRLTKDDPWFDAETRVFLGRSYDLKAIADDETGPGSKVTPTQAREAIAAARLFMMRLAELLDQ